MIDAVLSYLAPREEAPPASRTEAEHIASVIQEVHRSDPALARALLEQLAQRLRR